MPSRRHAQRERSRDEEGRMGVRFVAFLFIRICMLCLNHFNHLVDTLYCLRQQCRTRARCQLDAGNVSPLRRRGP